MTSPDRACNAIDLVAATIDALAGVVEHAIFGVSGVRELNLRGLARGTGHCDQCPASTRLLPRRDGTIPEAVKNDPSTAKRVEEVLGLSEKPSPPRGEKKNRRSPAPFDPYAEYAIGEESLLSKLRQLDIEALKNIVAQYGMDSSKLVMKWKTPDRIIDHISATVRARAQQGDAFRR